MPIFSRRAAKGSVTISDPGQIQTEAQNPRVKVVRTLTLPGGKKVRVVRQDALERAVYNARPIDAA